MKLYSKYDNLFFVSPSKWLYDCARQSALTRDKPLFHIPNLLDRTVFKPFDKKVAREILNIGPEERVILFGAALVQSPYKGLAYLQSALNMLHQQEPAENTSVLIFGSNNNPSVSESIPFRTRFMGQLKDEYTLAVLYNAADVFIAPSLADNLPYTIFESLACGTPVVAFNTGGIPDLIQHKVNGYLATYKDAEDLSRGISYCLSHELQTRLPIEMDHWLNLKKHLELLDAIKPLDGYGNWQKQPRHFYWWVMMLTSNILLLLEKIRSCWICSGWGF